ncbi:SDR family NAD(P)-dependent oxidoreductase [Rathayibacter tritici]|uniref:3-oxoacyl-ACP reductase n=1 Tax=Rathayibacter tritici TaxID=33888 RepID=A0A160KQ05_9MICO|nr:SDR family oxidoreductase [Rathayibacter tritici]AND15254.1 3-oxoacyl-ACP reductase [Rathayibacter tritici]PPI40990.1 KR domain-containing protein [Rathayibacter tritici]
MDLELAGKVALVTGASRGIGAAVVGRFVREGARVVGVSRSAALSPHTGYAVRMLTADVTDDGAASTVIEATLETFGRIDILVNNAGGGSRLTLAPFEQLSDDDSDDALVANLLAAVRMTRAALTPLAQARGTIVNVSSIGAHRVDGPPLAYNVAKAALTAFGSGVAPELAARGIRIATVMPGPTRTEMWDRFAEAAGVPLEAVLAKVPEQMGMLTGALIEPSEIADVIAYLSSPLAASVLGAEIAIDGGILRRA